MTSIKEQYEPLTEHLIGEKIATLLGTYLLKESAIRGTHEIRFIKSTAATSSVFDAASVKLLTFPFRIKLTVFTVSVISFSIPMHSAEMKRHLNV